MGEVFSKADLSELPKTKAKVKKRELTKAKSKVRNAALYGI